MKYKIVKDWPPNIETIRFYFGFGMKDRKPVFTYGDTIYCPHTDQLPEDLIEHEKTHIAQQANEGPDGWWADYFISPSFRLEQELEAYKAQYKFICENYSRPLRRKYLSAFARVLSSSMYGNIIEYKEALERIQSEV